jgi:hypothetical protein
MALRLISFALALTFPICAQAQDGNRQRLADELMQVDLDLERLHSSCVDLAKLHAIGATKLPVVTAMYERAAEERRRHELLEMASDYKRFGETIGTWTADRFAQSDAPDGTSGGDVPREDVANIRAELESHRCYDEAQIAELAPLVDQASALLEKRIATETACRASRPCMATRAAAEACARVAQRLALKAAIATERANPGGVVDLVKLHDLGQQVQLAEGSISDAKSRYAKLAGKPFVEALCK